MYYSKHKIIHGKPVSMKEEGGKRKEKETETC